MRWKPCIGGAWLLLVLLASCNSDLPEPASTSVSAYGRVTVTRIASHPFLARYNLRLTIQGQGTCWAEAELFPDTGHVGRRNLYEVSPGRLYLIGQYDARIVDFQRCLITLSEFHSLESPVTFLGSFDADDRQGWAFLSAIERRELPFEKQ